MYMNPHSERISGDWLWREKELREIDARLLRKSGPVDIKCAILIIYSHWEGHFKYSAAELLSFINLGIRRKLFSWTDIRPEMRQRLLFCSYRRSSLAGQTHETFISYLNALNEPRYETALNARDEIILIDDNLSALKAEAICRNLGVDHTWCSIKKIWIDERLVEYRNAIAHGAQRLRSGDEMDLMNPDILSTIHEIRGLIRETRNRFQNAIEERAFLASPARAIA